MAMKRFPLTQMQFAKSFMEKHNLTPTQFVELTWLVRDVPVVILPGMTQKEAGRLMMADDAFLETLVDTLGPWCSTSMIIELMVHDLQ